MFFTEYTDCKYGDDRSKARLSGSNAVAKGRQRLFSSISCQSEPVGLHFLSVQKWVIFWVVKRAW